MNDASHRSDGIGMAETRDVHDYWEKTLHRRISEAFHDYSEFDAFCRHPRTFTREPNVVTLPTIQRDELKKAVLFQTEMAAAALTDGRAGDGLATLEHWPSDKAHQVRLFNHDIYRVTSDTLEPIVAYGDFVIVSNHASVSPRDLVIAAVGDRRLARRFNETEAHPDLAVLTGQAADPSALVEPVIVPRAGFEHRKIVSVLFAPARSSLPDASVGHEVVPVADAAAYWSLLDQARLFAVDGRSAVPRVLDKQFLITRDVVSEPEAVARMDGRLVVAVDVTGVSRFKRLRMVDRKLAILESLNPDGTAPSEIVSLDGEGEYARLTHILPVVGALFELPGRQEKG